MPRERTGSILPLPSGRFRVLQRLPDGTRKSVGVCETEEEADALRRATLRVLAREAPDGTNTLKAYGSRWIKARRTRDADGDEGRWALHVGADPLARMALRAIQRHHVEDWLERMRAKTSEKTGKPLGAQTIRNALNLLRQCLDHACRRRLTKHNAALGVRVGAQARVEDEWHYLRPDEQRQLIDAVGDDERPMVVFAMTSGIRAGELVSLRLSDVHDDHVVIRYGGPPDAPTKGGRVRTVYLSSAAKEALDTWIANLPKYTATSKRWPNGRNPLALAFPGRHGGYRSANHVLAWEEWKAILASAKLERRFRWHDLRHTCGTSLACGWWGRVWSLQEIQAHLGHAQVSTTERYAKIATEEVRRAAAATTGGPGSEGHRKRSRLDHGPRSAARNRHKPAPSAGVGPAAFGLGSPRDASEIAAQNAWRDPSGANALALLLAAARGEHEEALRLADVVAPGRTVRAALDVAEAVLVAAQRRKDRIA